MDNNKNCCDNCRYFLKHYVNYNGDYKVLPTCGHCVNNNFTKSQRDKIVARERKCEFWEPHEIQTEQHRKSIKEVLRSMADRIEQIADILQKDEE